MFVFRLGATRRFQIQVQVQLSAAVQLSEGRPREDKEQDSKTTGD